MLSALFSCNGVEEVQQQLTNMSQYPQWCTALPPSLTPCKYQNPPEQIAAASSPSRMLMYCFGLIFQENHWIQLKELTTLIFIYSRHFIEDIPPVCSDGDDDLAEGLVHPAGKRFQVSRGSPQLSPSLTFSPTQPSPCTHFHIFDPRDGAGAPTPVRWVEYLSVLGSHQTRRGQQMRGF